MSLCVLGMAEEFARARHRRQCAVAAHGDRHRGDRHDRRRDAPKHCRRPEIVADAAHAILTRPARDFTGHFSIDDEVLREGGVTDFERYAVRAGMPLLPDLFLD